MFVLIFSLFDSENLLGVLDVTVQQVDITLECSIGSTRSPGNVTMTTRNLSFEWVDSLNIMLWHRSYPIRRISPRSDNLCEKEVCGLMIETCIYCNWTYGDSRSLRDGGKDTNSRKNGELHFKDSVGRGLCDENKKKREKKKTLVKKKKNYRFIFQEEVLWYIENTLCSNWKRIIPNLPIVHFLSIISNMSLHSCCVGSKRVIWSNL